MTLSDEYVAVLQSHDLRDVRVRNALAAFISKALVEGTKEDSLPVAQYVGRVLQLYLDAIAALDDPNIRAKADAMLQAIAEGER